MSNKEELKPELVSYITLLSAFQVVLNCQLELENTPFLAGKTKVKVREAINMLNLENSKNHRAIWNIDASQAANLMRGIELVGKQIAESNGIALATFTELSRKGFDLSKCIIKEMSDKELKEYQQKLK